MEIKRYEQYFVPEDWDDMIESKCGDWCKYEDIKKVVEENEIMWDALNDILVTCFETGIFEIAKGAMERVGTLEKNKER